MSAELETLAALRQAWVTGQPKKGYDYTLLSELEGAFVARSRDGLPALVIPVPEMPSTQVGRRASGCELNGHSSLHLVHGARKWDQACATLICRDPEVLDAFEVLAADIVRRIGRAPTWSSVLAVVEEWQVLLAPRGRPSAEVELGLWGELWFIAQSTDIDRTLGGWRGPERDATDFFVAGVGAEIKTSKNRRQHHVARTQVESPVGLKDSWLVSLWVKVDPAAKHKVPTLAQIILDRSADRADTQRRLARAGYTAGDRREYTNGFTILDEPEWYAIEDVPRVRAVDPGISDLRYRVTLDEGRSAPADVAKRLRLHFHGPQTDVHR